MFKYLLLLSTLLYINTSNAADIYFAKVINIDKNNIITVLKDDEKIKLRLSYLSTPVKNEFMHEELSLYLHQQISNQWIRISEQTKSKNKKLKAAIIRTPQHKMLNILVAFKGYAIPNPADNPPIAILNAIKIAKQNKYGLWKNIETFAKQRTEHTNQSHMKFIDDITKTVMNQKNRNHQPFMGNVKTKKYYPLKCGFEKEIKERKLFATSYAAEHQGYTRDDCEKKNKNIQN